MYMLKQGFEIVDVAGEQLAIPLTAELESFNGVVALSEAAVFLLSQLKSPKTEQELTDILIREYNLDRDKAYKDIMDFLKKTVEMGLIESTTDLE